MLFNSFHFLCFFPIVTLLYYLMPHRAKRLWLLILSYYFYMSWKPEYAALILISTVVTYAAGGMIGQTQDKWKRKVFLVGGIAVNLSILCYFKYTNFLVDTINKILGFGGIHTQIELFDIILPVGISFYTFQALGYLIDVWRGDTKAEKNFIKYALFISFFPQLVAGPIERSGNLLNQLESITQKRRVDYRLLANGFMLMVYGMFLKVVISDRIVLAVDYIFEHFMTLGGVELFLGAIAFSIQIYCDFSGYSLIAVGAAQVLGMKLMENFSTPYFAASVKEFWRRWHISLSSWFRDYVYIPLGGSRCSRFKADRNLMITFLLSGLWHGASWHFILWGGVHGAYQIVGKALLPCRNWMKRKLAVDETCFSYRLLQILITDLLVVFAWIFFRAENVGVAISYIQRIFANWDATVLLTEKIYTLGLGIVEMNILCISLVVLLFADLVRYKKGLRIDEFLERQNLWFRWFVTIMMAVMIVTVGKYGPGSVEASFIYFQF